MHSLKHSTLVIRMHLYSLFKNHQSMIGIFTIDLTGTCFLIYTRLFI